MRLIDADIFASELDFAEADVCEELPDSYCEFGFSREKIRELLRDIPTVDAVPVDTVAKMFCDFTGDSCACDFNGNDEWLPEVCELQDECPNPKDRLGCWKQYIKHYGERKE